MANAGSVLVTAGLEDVERMLRGLEAGPGKKLVRASLRVGAKVISKAAKAGAPKRTRRLADSIRVRSGGTKGARISVLVATSETDSMFKGDTFYGAFQEFGWNKAPTWHGRGDGQIHSRSRGTYGKGEATKMPGLHFMRKAADAAADAAIDAFHVEAVRRIELLRAQAAAGGATT
jgi:HK97 gp10 family phage protein